MATLHLLANPAAANACLAATAAGDSVLLLGDGVFAVSQLATQRRVGALREDAAERGQRLHDVESLTDADFVDWVVNHDRSITWT